MLSFLLSILRSNLPLALSVFSASFLFSVNLRALEHHEVLPQYRAIVAKEQALDEELADLSVQGYSTQAFYERAVRPLASGNLSPLVSEYIKEWEVKNASYLKRRHAATQQKQLYFVGLVHLAASDLLEGRVQVEREVLSQQQPKGERQCD